MEVRSRTSTEKYRETKLTAKEIGDELKVNYLLEGSVQKQGNEVKIHAQLIDVTNDTHIWSETYLRNMDSVFVIQSEIAKSIAKSLQSVITPEEKQRIESIPTKNLEAYDLYLKAKEENYNTFWESGEGKDLGMAISLYRKVIHLDPQFALAYVGLGLSIYSQSYSTDYFKKSLGDSLIYYANKALEINPNLAEGYWARGKYYFDNGNYDQSIEELKRAIDLNPSHGDLHMLLGQEYIYKSDYPDAAIYLEKARKIKQGDQDYKIVLLYLVQLYGSIYDTLHLNEITADLLKYDPKQSFYWNTQMHIASGETDKLRYFISKLCALDSCAECFLQLSIVNSYNGNFEEAYRYWEKLRLKKPEKENSQYYINMYHRYAYILYNLDRKKEAEIYFNKQIKNAEESIRLKRWYGITGANYDLAAIYAFLGDKEKAYHFLHEVEQSETIDFSTMMGTDPLFKSLRHEKEFQQIVRNIDAKFAAIRNEIQQLRDKGEL